MKLFLDSAKTDEIKYALDMWDIDGLTTNPKHVQTAGKPFQQAIEDIAKLFQGTDKPVSVEVNPHLTDWQEIVEAGVELANISPNFVIKVGMSETGCRAIRELSSQDIRVNATLVFTVTQAWHAARAGAEFISPFVGWKEQYGESTHNFIHEVATMLLKHGYQSKIIAAAIRNSRQLADAAIAGSHCATAGLAVYQEGFNSPFTKLGENIFQAAWDDTPH